MRKGKEKTVPLPEPLDYVLNELALQLHENMTFGIAELKKKLEEIGIILTAAEHQNAYRILLEKKRCIGFADPKANQSTREIRATRN